MAAYLGFSVTESLAAVAESRGSYLTFIHTFNFIYGIIREGVLSWRLTEIIIDL